MSKKSRLLGILGVILTLLGLVSYFFVGSNPYAMVHLVAGGLALVLFLITNAATLPAMLQGRATKQFSYSMVSTLLVAVILIAANIVTVIYPKSWDLTSEQLYSLSSQTKSAVKGLKNNVRAILFVQGGTGGAVEDLLRQYDYASNKFSYRVEDPEITPELVQKYGLTSAPILVLEAGQRNLKTSELTEEKITATLLQLEGGRKKTLYVLGEHGESSPDDGRSAGGIKLLTDRLKDENYNVLPLSLLRTAQVPANADAVLIVGPKSALATQENDQLARYLKRGGHIFVATDPGFTQNVSPLLSPLGLQLGNAIIVDQEVRLFAGPALGLQPVVRDYGTHVIGAPLKGRPSFFRQACDIGHHSVPGVKVSEIARTSDASWAETDLDQLMNEQAAAIDPEDRKGPLAIGVAVEGYAMPGSAEAPLEGVAKVVAFCDGDFLSNQFVGQMGNLDLVVNSINWLTGKEQSISIRPKKRNMSVLFITSDEMINVFFLTVLILPEFLLLLGLIVWWRRR